MVKRIGGETKYSEMITHRIDHAISDASPSNDKITGQIISEYHECWNICGVTI